MWWSLDHDDSWGSCNQGRFPLINAVNNVFKSNTDCPTVTDPSVSTTRRTTTTKITSTTVTSTPGSNIITGTVNAGDSSN